MSRLDAERTIYRRTKLIDDAKRPNPQYRGLVHGTGLIVRQEGLRGIYRGLFPVVCQRRLGSIKDLLTVRFASR